MNDYDDPLDPEVVRSLRPLKRYPIRDPKKKNKGLASLLAGGKRSQRKWPIKLTLPRPLHTAGKNNHRANPAVQHGLTRTGLKALIIICILLLGFFGGGTATILAVGESLPGDTLYPVKTTVEDVTVALSAGAAADAELHLRFAQRRLDEMSSLAAAGRFDDILTAAERFGYHIRRAIHNQELVAQDDPARAQELARSINAAIAQDSDAIHRLRAVAPEATLPAFDEELELLTLDPGQKPTPQPSPTVQPAIPPTSPPTKPPTPLPTGVIPTASPAPPPAAALDLDIHKFKVSEHVQMKNLKPVTIRLEIKNSSTGEGQRSAVVVGVQNGVEVYRQSLDVSSPAGAQHTNYDFPSYTPTGEGEIIWTATLDDDDPDEDTATETTRVTGSAAGVFDLDIHKFKVSKHIKLKDAKSVEISLEIDTPGIVDGERLAVVTGVQNGVVVYEVTLVVSGDIHDGRIKLSFPDYLPQATGEIVWTATLSDDDTDDDIVEAATQVEP